MVVHMIKGLDDPIVRQKAKKVGKVDAQIRSLIADLIDSMRAAPGVGLAAPQVGIPLRVAVVEVDKKLFTLVNPEIVERSKETQSGPEGCLSIPGYWADVERAMKVRVRALDKNGKRFTTTAEGFLARAFQHEIDHLDGVLYIDRLPSLDLLRRVDELEAEEEAATVG
ncbi:MAG TPA: peptide deformylase [Candidatus Dormibacteraeota bacterium]|nr:peptide deformylase [Candidatus Dormibacteraeota bacterium]